MSGQLQRGTREIIIEGLTAKNAHFCNQSCYYDRRHNRQGGAKYPENMRPADESPSKTRLVLINSDVGDEPVIGAKYSYFDYSTRGERTGRS